MYYSVFKGFNKGIYNCWKDCEREVKGYKGAIYKKFSSKIEAEEFLKYGKLEKDNILLEVYTDGSCINNGKIGSKGGIGVFFGDNDKRNISKALNIEKVTNNIAELIALKEALEILKYEDRDVIIYTDSKYCILCCTSYGKKQELKKWKEDIPNKCLVKMVYEMYNSNSNINLEYVRGHNKIYGNEMADKLAKDANNNEF